MKKVIKVIRNIFNDKCTIGNLYIEDKLFCWTLEDVVREKGIKIQGKTAIPENIYKLNISYSNRFKRDMIEILNVNNFTGVRIHGGNTAEDTEGCILVAHNKINNYTIQGTAEKDVFNYVKKQIDLKNEVFIEITI